MNVAAAKAMREGGATLQEVADCLGVSRSRVWQVTRDASFTRECDECGKRFDAPRADRRFCSADCSRLATGRGGLADGPATGFCACGCGQRTTVSPYTCKREGRVKGQPVRFVWGHGSRVNKRFDEARERTNTERHLLAQPRRERVAALYRKGVSFAAIAAELETTPEIVAEDVRKLRLAGVDLPYRNVPVRRYLTPDMASDITDMWHKGLRVADIAERFGWSRTQGWSVIVAMRAMGYDLTARQRLVPSDEERRKVLREYRKRVKKPLPLRTDGQRAVVRLLRSAGRPLRTPELFAFFSAATGDTSRPKLYGLLNYLVRTGTISRVESRGVRGKWLYFVPFGQERERETLTLADAQRETELAALLEEQEREIERGEWSQDESGHWGDVRLDAPVREDGPDWFELIEDAA